MRLHTTSLPDILLIEPTLFSDERGHFFESFNQYTDIAVIGGGFYGTLLANEIKSRQPGLDVTIVEKEAALFTQASASNQGQFHMGYMYRGLDITAGSKTIKAASVFNVTFADINRLHAQSGLKAIPLQHDTFLHFVMELPSQYQYTAATVIRGPYASLLPSSFRQGHVLASGKFRRIQSASVDKPPAWMDFDAAPAVYRQAVDEAAAYMPFLRSARYRGYTVGTRAAYCDPATGAYSSKALVFRDFDGMPDYHVVLGAR